MHNFKFRKRIVSLLEKGEVFAVAKLILVNGHAPQDPGTSMIVKKDKKIEFTIGGGPFEAEVIEDSVNLILSGGSIIQKKYNLNIKDLGMYCSGEAVVLIEVLKPPPNLFIFGAGHVGSKLANISAQLDIFNVFLIDDRKNFIEKSLFSKHESLNLVHTDENWMKNIPTPKKDSFLVVLTRCHATDKVLIKNYIYKDYAYLGMLGSKTKVKKMWNELQSEGLRRSALEKIYAPIGLKIGAKNPSEIAISVLGEILKVKKSTLS
tara:strand:+ start:808 stop:1596 length:789 start_codon:yes stop_codon:yes gene_type:complete